MYSKYKFCPFLFPLQYIQSVTLATHGKSPADAAQFSIGASDGEQNGMELIIFGIIRKWGQPSGFTF